MKPVFSLLLMLALVAPGASIGNRRRSALPRDGVIPDEQTAVAVARAIFLPVYGEEEVSKFEPYHAQLAHGTWTVYGTLKRGSKVARRNFKSTSRMEKCSKSGTHFELLA